MLSTFDCCPARFISACALHTCTEIPPCGGGYGPTKSTFIYKSPAPKLERNQCPQLQIQRTAAVVRFNQPFDVRLLEEPTLQALSRQEQVANVQTQLAAEPAAKRDGEAA